MPKKAKSALGNFENWPFWTGVSNLAWGLISSVLCSLLYCCSYVLNCCYIIPLFWQERMETGCSTVWGASSAPLPRGFRLRGSPASSARLPRGFRLRSSPQRLAAALRNTVSIHWWGRLVGSSCLSLVLIIWRQGGRGWCLLALPPQFEAVLFVGSWQWIPSPVWEHTLQGLMFLILCPSKKFRKTACGMLEFLQSFLGKWRKWERWKIE